MREYHYHSMAKGFVREYEAEIAQPSGKHPDRIWLRRSHPQAGEESSPEHKFCRKRDKNTED